MADFEAVVVAFAGRDGVTVGGGRGFGANALQVDGHIFAMSDEAGLVLKLPKDRVVELVVAGDGLPFDAGKGRPLSEWVVIPEGAPAEPVALAEEALTFVASRSRTGGGR